MKIYTVRKTSTTNSEGMSRWATFALAAKEVARLYRTSGLECQITTKSHG